MDRKNPTTVRFTEKAKPIKDELSPIYGLKNILSAGLILFGRLSDSEQKQIVREANGITAQDEAADADEAAASRDVKALKRTKARRKPSKAG